MQAIEDRGEFVGGDVREWERVVKKITVNYQVGISRVVWAKLLIRSCQATLLLDPSTQLAQLCDEPNAAYLDRSDGETSLDSTIVTHFQIAAIIFRWRAFLSVIEFSAQLKGIGNIV
ncbi:hypothetical protein DdX_12604 [Ditylenchus destructor]|uniref:Uncharacterized protein n=1 Tax=Ditylenchus destructor TaxID=166010 RepID=A0AAD4MWX4_9BILA|nr:hypothetical protein DdX_12604 [Ditylenchus destructor]